MLFKAAEPITPDELQVRGVRGAGFSPGCSRKGKEPGNTESYQLRFSISALSYLKTRFIVAKASESISRRPGLLPTHQPIRLLLHVPSAGLAEGCRGRSSRRAAPRDDYKYKNLHLDILNLCVIFVKKKIPAVSLSLIKVVSALSAIKWAILHPQALHTPCCCSSNLLN